MARSTKTQVGGSDRTKVRVFYAEVDGSNQSVHEMMRALTNAMGRSPQIMSPQRLLRSTEASDGDGATAQHPESEILDDEQLFDGQSEVAAAEPEASTTRRRRGEGPKKDRNSGIELVPSLDLVQEGGTSLKDFVNQKNLKTDEEKVLVFAYYLVHHVNVSPIGPGHILTCFTNLGERKPLDLKQTIRNFAKKKGWLNCADMNDLKLTTAGENHVKHELGKGDDSGTNRT